MTDTITESFCERCGTRYSFEQTTRRRRGAGIGRVRVLTRGLRNYVANDGMPMDEAMAAAQSDEERAGVSRQLDAFHKTFNFCMSCRQYTCATCWNAKVGECLTCAPDLAREVLPPLVPDLPLDGPAEAAGAPLDAELALAAWPTADLARLERDLAEPETLPAAPPADSLTGKPAEDSIEEPAVLARLDMFVGAPLAGEVEDLTAIELAEIETALAAHPPVGAATVAPAEAPAEPEVAAAAEAPAEPEVAAAAEAPAEPESQPADPAARATTARSQTRSLLGRFRPGRTADAAALATAGAAKAAATEPEAAALEPAPTPELPTDVDAVASEPVEPAAAVEPAIDVAAPVVEPAIEVAAAPMAEPPTAPADTIEQPTWRIVAPDGAAPAQGWPDAPAWPTADPRAGTGGPVPGSAAAPWASRLATARPEPANVWAASTQEVLAAPGPIAAGRPGAPAIQACVSCGLSLSSNARFCRRCGSRQG